MPRGWCDREGGDRWCHSRGCERKRRRVGLVVCTRVHGFVGVLVLRWILVSFGRRYPCVVYEVCHGCPE